MRGTGCNSIQMNRKGVVVVDDGSKAEDDEVKLVGIEINRTKVRSRTENICILKREYGEVKFPPLIIKKNKLHMPGVNVETCGAGVDDSTPKEEDPNVIIIDDDDEDDGGINNDEITYHDVKRDDLVIEVETVLDDSDDEDIQNIKKNDEVIEVETVEVEDIQNEKNNSRPKRKLRLGKTVRSANLDEVLRGFSYCPYCHIMPGRNTTLQLHVLEYHPDEQLKCCLYCSFMTFFPSSLRNHNRSCHGVQACPHCDFNDSTKERLEHHISSTHQIKKPTLETKEPTQAMKKPALETKEPTQVLKKPALEIKEPTQVMKKPALETKEPTQVMKKPALETKEPTQVLKKPALEAKEPSHDIKKRTGHKNIYYCRTCKHQTTTRKELQEHMRALHSYSCSECSYVTTNQRRLESHYAKHSSPEEESSTTSPNSNTLSSGFSELFHDCPLCNYRANSYLSISQHMAKHHQTKSNGRDCHVCDFRGSDRYSLSRHLYVAHNCIDCPFCSYRARSKIVLKAHIAEWHDVDSDL